MASVAGLRSASHGDLSPCMPGRDHPPRLGFAPLHAWKKGASPVDMAPAKGASGVAAHLTRRRQRRCRPLRNVTANRGPKGRSRRPTAYLLESSSRSDRVAKSSV